MNLKYTISEIIGILETERTGTSDQVINQIFIDSRNYFGETDSLFIAIKGPSNDGHDYLKSLYEQGCRYFIVSNIKIQLPEDVLVLVVSDTLVALQKIAAHHRKKFTYPVVAITGSNGKTFVKEWLYHFLKNKYNIVRSPKSFNSKVGVPLSLLQMSAQHTLAIIEAGISHPNEMFALKDIIHPNLGVLTHIGSAHSENFSSEDAIEQEKLKLFEDVEWYYSFRENNAIYRDRIVSDTKTELILEWQQEPFSVQIPYTDEAAVENAITTISFLLRLGVSKELIISEATHLPSIALRLESRKGKDQNIIINDSYSNDLDSLNIALNYLSNANERPQKVLILSDIQQDKHGASDLYKVVSEWITARKIDAFYGIGPDLLRQRHLFAKGDFFESTQQFLNYISDLKVENSVILIKGARKFGFEKIGKYFEQKTHETKLTIDLGALRSNIKEYQTMLNPNTKLLCMVKAFGYGSGSKEIGKILQQCKVDYLGVAYADEGEDLREENIQLPIMVMNPEEGSYDKIIANKLEPSIYSFRQLDQFIRTLIDHDIKSYPIHVKIDTGMRRLGFLTNELEELLSTISSQPEVRVKSIFSHLAASDVPQEDLFTQKQIQIFQYACHQLETGLGYNCIKHTLNTAGIERFSHAQMDMVRLGLGMYGDSSTLQVLHPVGALTSVISQIKKVKKGESIGYNRSQYALNDMLIGVVPIGYADGFSRSLSDGKGHVWIQGKLAPVVGKVCMDMTMVDLSKITAKEGDTVEIFGSNRSLKDLAKEMDTITYEVMTSISQRVVRVYID